MVKNSGNVIDLDNILENEVKFGKFQIIIILLIAFPIFLNGVQTITFIFAAGNLNYRCEISECDDVGSSNSEFLPEWLNFAVPFEATGLPQKCDKFESLNSSQICTVESFNSSNVIKCDKYVYEDEEFTILNEFSLNCDKEFLLSLIGTINNIGQLFCFLLTGFISDKYGRRSALIIGCLGAAVFGILRIFAFNYTMYAVFEFFDALFGGGTYSTAYIIGLELVTPRLRTLTGTFLNCFYAFGEIYLGLIAMWFKNYRMILLFSYVPGFFTISFICLLPQSIRWLITKGLNEEAKKILIKAAKQNGSSLSENSLMMFDEKIAVLNNSENDSESDDTQDSKISRRAIIQILNLSYIWFSTLFVYFGLNINAVYLEYWNKYVSFIIVCLIELPSYFITNIMMESIGRKKTLFVGLIGSGIFCIVSEFIPGVLLKTIAFVIGKLLISISFSCLYIFTIEVFPTNLRHRFFSISSISGRIGNILAPLTPLLAQSVSPQLPLIMFRSILNALHERGHNVTALTPDVEASVPNLTYLHLEKIYPAIYNGTERPNFFEWSKLSKIEFMFMILKFNKLSCSSAMDSKGYERLLAYPNEFKFDLVIYDNIGGPCLLLFLNKFNNPPMISATAFNAISRNAYYAGGLISPGVVPGHNCLFATPMTFKERIKSTIIEIILFHLIEFYLTPSTDKMVRARYPEIPYLGDLEKSAKMFIINSFTLIDQKVANFPNLKQIGGVQIQKPKQLSDDLIKIIDEAKDGIVFFSLGTNVRSDSLGEERIVKIIKALEKLPTYTFLWKFETKEKLPIKLPAHIVIQSWWPQSDILAHPKTKLFMSHSGLLSTQEALWYGVPILGIPIFGDQFYNIFQMQRNGVAQEFSLHDFTENQLFEIVSEMLLNENYLTKAKNISFALRDQPMTPINEAIFWI
ncbi:CLUMA_CG008236, isoform A, partial [Clunio marinus]